MLQKWALAAKEGKSRTVYIWTRHGFFYKRHGQAARVVFQLFSQWEEVIAEETVLSIL